MRSNAEDAVPQEERRVMPATVSCTYLLLAMRGEGQGGVDDVEECDAAGADE
jgi:hypothetical protein